MDFAGHRHVQIVNILVLQNVAANTSDTREKITLTQDSDCLLF